MTFTTRQLTMIAAVANHMALIAEAVKKVDEYKIQDEASSLLGSWLSTEIKPDEWVDLHALAARHENVS